MPGWTLQPPVPWLPSAAESSSRRCVACVPNVGCVAQDVVAPGVDDGAYWLLAMLAAVSKSNAAAARHVLAAVGIGAVVRPDFGVRRLIEQGIHERTGVDGGERRLQRRVRCML